MKRTLFAIATALLLAAGCGGPAESCQTANCSTGGKTYQACATAGSTQVTYKFGGDSCTCDAGNQTACTDCATKVANYCSM